MKSFILSLAIALALTAPAFAESFPNLQYVTEGAKSGKALTAAGSCTSGTSQAFVRLEGTSAASIVVSGTFVGTLTFKASADDKVTFNTATAYPQGGGVGVSTATGTGTWLLNPSGQKWLCVYFSAYTSGTATVKLAAASGHVAQEVPQLVQPGGLGSSGYQAHKVCDSVVKISQAALNGAAEIVSATAGKKIYVCGYSITSTAAAGISWVEGTGTNCGTGQAAVTGVQQLAAKAQVGVGPAPYAMPFTATAADALCIKTDAASDTMGVLWYSKQ